MLTEYALGIILPLILGLLSIRSGLFRPVHSGCQAVMALWLVSIAINNILLFIYALIMTREREEPTIASQPDYVYDAPSWDPWGKALVFQQFNLRGAYKPEIDLWQRGMEAPKVVAEGIMSHWLP